MTLVYLHPGTQVAVAAVYSCPRPMDRCSEQQCVQVATGELQHFCGWLPFVRNIYIVSISSLSFFYLADGFPLVKPNLIVLSHLL